MLMKSLCLFFVLIFSLSILSAQQKFKVKNSMGTITEILRQDSFPAGYRSLELYIKQNTNPRLGCKCLKIPAKDSVIRKTVVVDFIISEDGYPIELHVENENTINRKLVKESIRVIKQSPQWTPSVQNGIKVIIRHRSFIYFECKKKTKQI